MRYNILSHLPPRSYTASAAALALGIYTIMNQRRPAALDSGTASAASAGAAAAKQAVFGGGVGFPFMSLPLESAEMVTHDTKRLRFRLPSPDAVSGLPLTSAVLTMSWPKDSWTPVIRPYTPISYSADEVGHIDFLIKHYPSGKQSTHIHSLTPGQTLTLLAMPIKGPQWKPSTSSPEHITLIAGGAGITPIYQLARGVLRDTSDTSTAVTLIFGVNTDKDVLLREELRDLERQHPSRFRAVYAVSELARAQAEGEGGSDTQFRSGRITRELLEEVVPKPERAGRVFICGPPAMETALVGGKRWGSGGGSPGILEQLGYQRSQIHRF